MKALILAASLLASAAFADEAAKPEAAKPEAAKPEAAKPAKKAKAGMDVNFADLKWAELKDTGGIQMAPVMGDMSKGAFTAMIKFPAGMMQAQHTHSPDMRVVVISGTLMAGADTASAKEFGPGSFRFVPGGYKHITGCKAGADCVVYVQGTAKFDHVPVEEMKAEKKEEKMEQKK